MSEQNSMLEAVNYAIADRPYSNFEIGQIFISVKRVCQSLCVAPPSDQEHPHDLSQDPRCRQEEMGR